MEKCNTLEKSAENIEISRLVSQIFEQVEFLETLISDEQMPCWISKNFWEIRKEIQKEAAIFSKMQDNFEKLYSLLNQLFKCIQNDRLKAEIKRRQNIIMYIEEVQDEFHAMKEIFKNFNIR